jgi:hypothetical protein
VDQLHYEPKNIRDGVADLHRAYGQDHRAVPKWANALTLIAALCAAYLGALMKDAGTQLAILQGETEPKGVPSHEVPDQPGTKVVKP